MLLTNGGRRLERKDEFFPIERRRIQSWLGSSVRGVYSPVLQSGDLLSESQREAAPIDCFNAHEFPWGIFTFWIRVRRAARELKG
jgi:hypothetical protein